MIVGIDEVGRGCWAGPVVAGAVLLGEPIKGLNDSKKLTRKQRERLDAEIRLQAVAFGLGWVSASELDAVGLTEAVRLAMERALAQIHADYDELVIDGNLNYFAANPRARAVIAADSSVPAVSAASIIAKVARDRFMAQQSRLFPGYSFDRHVGYGTAAHLAALQSLGLCELHRRSFKPIQAFIV
ncbi:MAG TPA: ribonuclease HII [Candidatus Saccharimonadales bacterium]|nr:ribonuclease HII [Candidatus Saccharimonadales bacterium]